MKIPNPISRLLQQKKPHEVMLSLVISHNGVAASAWYVDESGLPHTIGFAQADVPKDNWEERTAASDRAIATVEEQLDESTQISKVVLGLPSEFLTDKGDIDPGVRPNLKHLTQELDLTPIGFVSLHQALVYKLKKDEGMPPSVILLGFTDKNILLTLYKVGQLIGVHTIHNDEELSLSLEHELKSFKELEVLPSRILLYGMKVGQLDEAKEQLMRHPWPTKANFLHFPKFDQIIPEEIVTAVTLAGASEIATALVEEEDVPELDNKTETEKDLEVKNQSDEENIENVKLVEPEELGFQKEEEKVVEEQKQPRKSLVSFVAKIKIPKLPKIPKLIPNIKSRGTILLAVIIVILILAFSIINWTLPKATVTIIAIPQSIQSSVAVSVDSTALSTDSTNTIIPGHIREESISGEKTIQVTGSKEVGDPAKGNVIIYNKSLASKTFKKGAVLISSGLNFTLDSDVNVASASESIGSITFGKATGTITAQDIGQEGNLPPGTEFTFKDTSSSVAIARNDQALAGGTSKVVTVVSRNDYDTLVSSLTEELLSQIKEKLITNTTGGEKLVEQTIKTSVTEKTFAQELNQESSELNGKITITVSGVSYNESDLVMLFEDSSVQKLQAGYTIVKDQTKITIKTIQVKKDGTIRLTADVSGVALPTIDNESIKKAIAGKNVTQAQEYLRTTSGVGGAEFRFRWTLIPNRLPQNSRNISLSVALP